MKNNLFLFTTLLIISISLLSCKQKGCQPFYEYDEIEWYNFKRNLDSIPPDLQNNKFLVDVFQGQTFLKIKDVDKLVNLSNNDFNKSTISTLKNDKLNKLFCFDENQSINGFMTACIPFYNDILVFKKENKIVGIAKICFKCEQSTFTESDINTDAFGAKDEFKKLKNILYSK